MTVGLQMAYNLRKKWTCTSMEHICKSQSTNPEKGLKHALACLFTHQNLNIMRVHAIAYTPCDQPTVISDEVIGNKCVWSIVNLHTLLAHGIAAVTVTSYLLDFTANSSFMVIFCEFHIPISPLECLLRVISGAATLRWLTHEIHSRIKIELTQVNISAKMLIN